LRRRCSLNELPADVSSGTNSDEAPNYRIGANHSYIKVSPNHAKRVDKFARLLENGEEDHAA